MAERTPSLPRARFARAEFPLLRPPILICPTSAINSKQPWTASTPSSASSGAACRASKRATRCGDQGLWFGPGQLPRHAMTSDQRSKEDLQLARVHETTIKS
jgi:hypothetical protein